MSAITLDAPRRSKHELKGHTICASVFGVGAGFGIMSPPIYIGVRGGSWQDGAFGLSVDDAKHHVLLAGKTGSGKSTLLRNILVQHIEAGHGVGLLDPHGDVAEELLDFIPPWRTDHVAYFNATDREFPFGLNVLAKAPADDRHRITSGIVSAFKSIWRESWGPRLEYILSNALSALLDCENASLLGLVKIFHDDRYRHWVIRQVKDPLVRAFWIHEFERYDTRFRQEAIAPIQNKVGQFLMNAPVRNILGQVGTKLDFRFMMDERRIFIANLSKGIIGEDKANLLGSLLVSQFQLAALSRANMAANKRETFFLVIDEFSNFSTDSFASILSESRKYGLALTLAAQFTEQLTPEIRQAVFGNVGTLITFRIGHQDAKIFEAEFGHTYPADAFVNLPNHEILIRLQSNGVALEPFQAKTFPPSGERHGRREHVIRRSRERFTAPRREVKGKIERWLNHWE